ncbi:MAG: histidine kinase, partial [Saprospiraceae bacterium]
MNTPVTCFLFLLQSFLAIGQESSLPFHTLSTAQGLSQSDAPFVYKDRKGLVWIGTVDGLNCFAGGQVIVYKPVAGDTNSMLGNILQSPIFEDKEQNLWFTTESAINCFVRRTGHFQHFFVQKDGYQLVNEQYYIFCLEQNQYLWVIANDDLFRFNIHTHTTQYVHALKAVRCAADTATNGQVRRVYACLWGYGKGVAVFDYDCPGELPVKKKPSRLYFSGDDKKSPALVVEQALVDENHLAWLATDQGLFRFQPDDSVQNRLFDHWRNQPIKVRSITSWNPGKLLLATDRFPSLCFTKGPDTFTAGPAVFTLEKTISLPDGTNAIYADRDNMLWLGGAGKGLLYTSLQAGNFRHPFPAGHSDNPDIVSFDEVSEGQVWACSNSLDAWQIQGAKTRQLSYLPKLFTFCHDSKRRIWAAGNHYFGEVDVKTQRFSTVIEEPGTVFLLNYLEPHTLCLGTTHGLLFFDPETRITTPVKGVEGIILQAFQDRRKRFWVFDAVGKIQMYQMESWASARLMQTFDHVGFVNAFHETIDAVWAATSKGLLRIGFDDLQPQLFDESNGFPNQYIQSMVEDKSGQFWLGTNRGILRFDPHHPDQIRQFTTSDGLSSDEYSSGAAFQAYNGELWFGGKNGIDIFYPEKIRDLGKPPQLALIALRIHGRLWQGDTAINEIHQVQLNWRQNALTFEMAALEYLDPAKNRYKVWLVGYDKTWVSLGTQNFVTYANIPPGQYWFKFIACNVEGLWNEDPHILSVYIAPPFYKTNWFYALLVGLILALAFGVYKYRVTQLRKEFALRQLAKDNELKATENALSAVDSEMRALRAQMNPHFIFNSLNSINAYILRKEGGIASGYLTEFAHLMRQILDNSTRETISLEQELEFLESYLRTEALRMEGKLAYHIKVAEQVDPFETQIPSMVLQPYLENAIWHGIAHRPGGGRLTVTINRDGSA